MTEKERQIQSKLLRMEAQAVFSCMEESIRGDRWWFFREARRVGYPYRVDKSMSDYRSWMRMDYWICGIPVDIYLEREIHQERVGKNQWTCSIYVEGKGRETELQNHLQPLKELGYEVGSGNENLERQMNFSLGLYGACQMHVIIYPRADSSAIGSMMTLFDFLDEKNRNVGMPLRSREQDDANEYDFDDNVIFGDWQTWK